MPLTHLLDSVWQLLRCWNETVDQEPAVLQVVARTLLPLVQQLPACNSLLMPPAAAAAAAPAARQSAPSASVRASSCSGSWEHQLLCALYGIQEVASSLINAMHTQNQLNGGFAAEVLRLQKDPAVAEMQLQLLTAWAAQLHKQHTAQQQQQFPAGAAAASSSSSTQQQQQQPAKQQHRADLLSIPAFHQDMLQLLPGGQAYLDAAAEEAAGLGLSAEKTAVQLRYLAGCCCQTINQGLLHHLGSIAGQQQLSRNDLLVSCAAVRLLLELTLLASAAVQRQREQQRQQQQQQQQAMSPQNQEVTDVFAVQTWDLLMVQIKALAVTSRSCLPPEVLQQAGLQLLQALAAPLQQWQLSKAGDSFMNNAGAGLPLFANTLQGLVTAACGAQPATDKPPIGEH
jgi:hypothetical protein